jgi:hypothetical protein
MQNALIRMAPIAAAVAVFLAGPDSGWLTGEQILASGGLR